ncbi:MAG TPA: hypothetical protein VK541_10465 [Pedobacter sp.]|uniref:hypothetical protein n=1 Tax=Pedobacter sp. TaxID=1411316 RepID=UPI002BFB694E|nr:hypothetical protein [Pedobacter sp.]HMI02896.1 hypothetical protein [Pedobacter sp.]
MYHQEPKKATKPKKLKLFRDLLSLLPDLKIANKQTAELIFIRFFYLIFGFENMVIDQNGYIYKVSGKEELISLFMTASNIRTEDKNLIKLFKGFYRSGHSQTDDLDIYIRIFSKLKELGFDFKYVIHSTSEKVQSGVDLERADRLIDALKKFLAENQSNVNFIDEHILLNNIDLPKIQERLRDQILHKKIGDMAPDKVLVAYYKVYQKLPNI